MNALNDFRNLSIAPAIRVFGGNNIFVDLVEADPTEEDLIEFTGLCSKHSGVIDAYVTYVKRIGTHAKPEHNGRPVLQHVCLTYEGGKWKPCRAKGKVTAAGRRGVYLVQETKKPA